MLKYLFNHVEDSVYIIKSWEKSEWKLTSFCESFQEKVGAWVGKMWQMSAARWQEGGSSGHKPETEKLVWEGESKLTPSCRKCGQGVRKDKEQEKEWEEVL